MLRTIFLFEWKHLCRSKSVWAALLVFAMVGCLAVNKGVSHYQFQQQEADSVRATHLRKLALLKIQFDTLDFSKPERYEIEGPWALDWQLGEYAIKPANVLSALSIGQTDVLNGIKRTRFSSEIFANEMDAFKNPEQLLAGNLDFSYFILFLFPIFFIALSYNIVSADRESGIFPLLLSQSNQLTAIINYRLLFKWLVSLLPVLVAGIYAWLSIRHDANYSASAFAQWIGIAVLYMLCWWWVVQLVISQRWNSMVNVLVLAGIWLGWLVAIPGMLNSWFQYKYPHYTQQLVTQLRDQKLKIEALPVAEQKAFVFQRFPFLAKDSARINEIELKWAGYAIRSFLQEKEVHTTIQEQLKQQIRQEEKWFWINPVGGVLSAFGKVSGSSLDAQIDFEKSVMQLKSEKIDYLFSQYLGNLHFGKAAFEGLPLYHAGQKKPASFLLHLLPLMIIAVCCLLAGSYHLAKTKHTF
jgi:ABC-2 type transport system permease protein